MRTARCLLVTAMLLLCSGAAPIRAEEADWNVGLASIRITPEEPVRMAGYAGRKETSTGVACDLYAKALALEDREGQRAVIVTTDLIGFRAALAEPTCRRIMDAAGLDREQILLNSSHTHTGPTIRPPLLSRSSAARNG